MSVKRQPLDPPPGSRLRAFRLADGVLVEFPHAAPSGAPLQLTALVALAAVGAFGVVVGFSLLFLFGVRVGVVVALPSLLLLGGAGVALFFLVAVRGAPAASSLPDEPRQLGVSDGILIRKGADGGRQLWYREDVGDVRAESYWHGEELRLGVLLRLGDAEPLPLYGAVPFAKADELQRAELEWVAGLLRGALGIADDPANPPPSVQPVQPRGPSDAITEKNRHVRRAE